MIYRLPPSWIESPDVDTSQRGILLLKKDAQFTISGVLLLSKIYFVIALLCRHAGTSVGLDIPLQYGNNFTFLGDNSLKSYFYH